MLSCSLCCCFVDFVIVSMETIRPDCFVVCERKKMMRLSELEGSCVQLVEEKQQLAGYKVIVIKDWVLNHAR